MKDRYYLRYDGTETEQCFSAAEAREMEAVGRIHAALTRLDAARNQLAVEAEAVRREVRNSRTPRQIRADFEKFWAAGGASATEYKDWFCGRSNRPTQPVPQRKHMRLVVNKAAPVVRRESLPRERLYDDDGPEAA